MLLLCNFIKRIYLRRNLYPLDVEYLEFALSEIREM